MAAKSRKMQSVLKLRVSASDREGMTQAAEAVALTLSAWMRAVLLERVAELRKRGVI